MESKELYKILYKMMECYDELDERDSCEYNYSTDKQLGEDAPDYYKGCNALISTLETELKIKTEEDRNRILGIVKEEKVKFDGFTTIPIIQYNIDKCANATMEQSKALMKMGTAIK